MLVVVVVISMNGQNGNKQVHISELLTVLLSLAHISTGL